ncbi:MAG: DUF1501 domain-containing protein [Burkholderiaceae bacterium]
MQRRDILKAGALTGAALGLGLLPVGRHAWAALADPVTERPRRLVVLMLRGAVDGLSIVVPYADPGYARARSSIALGRPGSQGGVLDLDGRFGLHPALEAMMPLWSSGKLAFVQACGSPDTTRSHFDAQDYMESGTPGRKTTPDGWLNRLVGVLPVPTKGITATRAVSIGPVLPRIYAGANAVANIASGNAATRPTVLDQPAVGQAFDKLYSADDKLSRAYQASRQSRREVMGSLQSADAMEREMKAANNGAPLPNGFVEDATRLATLMRNDARVQLAFMDLGGWDTHANQGASSGQLANRLNPVGSGLAAMAARLGPVFEDTVVVVMSEFGRTVRQNGNGGTDHGHGNVMWLLGGAVAGGAVHGRWPGLDASALYEGRDLAVTTDFRSVLAELLERHMLLGDQQLDKVLPQFRAPEGLPGVIRAV